MPTTDVSWYHDITSSIPHVELLQRVKQILASVRLQALGRYSDFVLTKLTIGSELKAATNTRKWAGFIIGNNTLDNADGDGYHDCQLHTDFDCLIRHWNMLISHHIHCMLFLFVACHISFVRSSRLLILWSFIIYPPGLIILITCTMSNQTPTAMPAQHRY